MKIKTTCERALPYLYSGVMFFSATASAGSTFLTTLYSKLPSAKSNVATAYACGMLVGIIEWMNTYYFEVPVIRKNSSSYKALDEDENTTLIVVPRQLSRKKQSAYLTIKYAYITSAILIDFLNLCVLVSASKALTQDLEDGQDVPLTNLTPFELSMIALYFSAFDLPFILTNKITQTCKQIRRTLGIPSKSAGDAKFILQAQKSLQCFARSNFFREAVVRIPGSLSDSAEHIGPLLLILPASWILAVVNKSPVYAWCAGIGGGILLLVTFGTVFTQTYLFEGRFSDNNLKRIAWPDQPVEPEKRWIPAPVSKVFAKFLNLPAFLHGADEAFSITIAMRELGLHPGITITSGVLSFLIVTMGKFKSEVAGSKDALQKITKDPNAQRRNSVEDQTRKSLFKFNYHYGALPITNGHIQDPSAREIDEILKDTPTSKPSGLGA